MLRRFTSPVLLATLFTGLLTVSCASPAAPDTQGEEAVGEAASALVPGCVTIMRGGAGNGFDTHLAPGNGNWAAGFQSGTWTGGNNNQAAFQFDLSAVPANANVTSATFDVYASWNSESATVEAHETLTAWTEATAKWSNMGGTSNYAAEVLGSFNPIWGSDGHRTVSVTDLTKAWLAGTKANNGIMLVQPTGGSHNYFTSESGIADRRPSLTVCWDGEINVDDCAANPCQNGGTCTDGDNSYTCECPAGFLGTNCEIVDHCADDPCHINAPAPGTSIPGGAACTNTADGFTCECGPLAVGDTCETECPCADDAYAAQDFYTFYPWILTGLGAAPSFECTTTPGGGTLTLGNGVVLNLDASSCSDNYPGITPYSVASPAEHAACQKIFDTSIAQYGLTCTVDNCSPNPCQNSGTCTSDADGYTCACPAGWTGTNCEIDVDECAEGDPCNINAPAPGNAFPSGAACTNTEGSFTCECVPFAVGTTCETVCPCVNDAANAGDFYTYYPWALTAVGAVPSLECATTADGGTLAIANGLVLSLDASTCSINYPGTTPYSVDSPAEHSACQKVFDTSIAQNDLTCSAP